LSPQPIMMARGKSILKIMVSPKSERMLCMYSINGMLGLHVNRLL